ncbi:MAG TPA: sigma 54-interacting transcriptional regulator [Bryobacteraceae bacterium]|nr:sigma 54-interacting transcriptional regulator [Bryobacteraceae bacterium]
MALQQEEIAWLVKHGPAELERLLRAIVYHPSAPVLITDNDRRYHEASFGARRLLGAPREQIIGRSVDDFAEPVFQHNIPDLWHSFLLQGEQEGTLRLLAPDGTPREVEYKARINVLPVRHLLVLREKTAGVTSGEIPRWVQDYALFLVDPDGTIAAWYSGAERIFGYSSAEAAGRNINVLYPSDPALDIALRAELKRAETEGHFGNEGWCMRKDGSRFWANVITSAVRDPDGRLRGFARAVRDFSDRRERDQKLRETREHIRSAPVNPAVAGIVSGEFDRIPEANDAFLDMLGYRREDLESGKLHWPELTPPEYFALDELAHEEGLCFGACTPFGKELIRKDGTRVPVVVTTAVLAISPFRWITFLQDMTDPDKPVASEPEGEPDEEVDVKGDFSEIVGRSPALKRILAQVELVAPTNATVLILGETGTGKELVARAVHRVSDRRDRPFVTLNCAAIPTGLLESELFGYERGAFTGALSQKIGRFEMAHRGTLFLDEVGDIPLDLQPKLLRALQEKAFERLGGTRTIPIDVRLVAATNRNLTQMMGDKLFRSDLYYRLKVFPITTAPLRDHPEDIPVLVRHFTKKYSAEMNKVIDVIPAETMRALVNWPWPGNVRELENFMERAVILSRGPHLRAPLDEIRTGSLEAAGDTLEQMEREHVIRVLRETGGVITKAAARLGMPRTTLNALMRKLNISRADL